MSKNILMPDYNHSILNLITSILKNYKVESQHSGLEKLDILLKKQYNNIVLVILDGMGENILKEISPKGIFSNNKKDVITSVFPSTTTAAMNTYYSGKPPYETGWIAWSQYFKEYGKSIDLLPQKDSYTGEKLEIRNKKVTDIIGYKTIFEQIEEQNIKAYEIVPDYCSKRSRRRMIANTIEEMSESIITLCKNPDKKFILCYNDNPDGIIHKNGCYSEETKEFILKTEKEFEKILKNIQNTNTLIIISADHGHQDIAENINILDLKDIQEFLIMPPTFESRMIGFFVHGDQKEKFKETFNKKFKDKYILYSKEEFLKSNLLGYGKEHEKIKDFLGDFIAIAISDTRIILETYLSQELKPQPIKKSTHCGLTKNEMEVPLIIFDISNK